MREEVIVAVDKCDVKGECVRKPKDIEEKRREEEKRILEGSFIPKKTQ